MVSIEVHARLQKGSAPILLNIADAYVCTCMQYVHIGTGTRSALCSYTYVLAARFIEKANSCGFFSGQATQFAKNLAYQITEYISRNTALITMDFSRLGA